MSLGRTIARLRAKKGWTQAQLAEQLGMNAAHINRLEHDKMQPRPRTVERLSTVFEVSTEELLAAAEPVVTGDWAKQDPELKDLLNHIPMLSDDQRHALRTFLRSMVVCQQIQQLTYPR